MARPNAYLGIVLSLWALGAVGRASTYTVANTNGDTSPQSLGAALTGAAASSSSADLVTFTSYFDYSLNPRSITLTGSYPTVSKASGTGSLTISAPTLLTVNDGGFTVFSFSGGGTFSLGNLALQGTGTGLSLGSNTSVSLSSVSVADGVTLGGTGAINVASGTTATFSGKVSGGYGLSETGPGTLVLSSTSNNYTGATAISGGGTVQVSSDSNLGSVDGGISLNNGTLATTSGITTSRPVYLAGSGGSISVASGQTSSFSGQIQGGVLTASGAGTLVLGNSSNNQSGTAIAGGGILSVANGNSLGFGNLSINGSTLQTTGSNQVNVFGAVAVSNGATINVVNSAQTTSLNSVTGTGGLNVTGAGTVELSRGSFTGGLTVTGATVSVQQDADLGAASSGVTLNGGTLTTSLGLFLQSSRAITLGTNGGTFAVNNGGQTQLSGIVSGGGSLTASGPGEVVLENSANSYSGGTVVTGGAILSALADADLGASTGSVTLDNGTFAGPQSGLSTSRTFVLGAGGGTIFPTNDQAVTLSGKVTGEGALTVGQSGFGTLVLTGGTNDYSGGTTVTFGHTLLVQNGTSGSATGSGALIVNAAATIGGAGTIHASTFTLQNGSQVIVGTGTDTTSQTTLTGQTASTMTGVNLQFNLGVGPNQGQSNLLDLGSTPITFNSTTLSLNPLGSGSIAANTSYVLFAFDNPVNAAADGLTVGSNGQVTAGLSIAANSSFGPSANGYTTGPYAGSYLFVDGNDIDLEVVPEPSSMWLLALGMSLFAGVLHGQKKGVILKRGRIRAY